MWAKNLLFVGVCGGALVALVSLVLIALANRQPAYTAEVKGEARAEIGAPSPSA